MEVVSGQEMQKRDEEQKNKRNFIFKTVLEERIDGYISEMAEKEIKLDSRVKSIASLRAEVEKLEDEVKNIRCDIRYLDCLIIEARDILKIYHNSPGITGGK